LTNARHGAILSAHPVERAQGFFLTAGLSPQPKAAERREPTKEDFLF